MADMLKKERGVVARGRSVVAPTGKTRIGKYTDDGKPIIVPVLRTFSPNEEIELPADEIAWLRSTGHLVDPHVAAELPAEGARVSEQASRGVVGYVGSEARG